MNCAEAEVYVSVLYDGEPIPPNAAQHIAACESCRRILTDYSRMGVDLRLSATIEPAHLPPLRLSPVKHLFDFCWRRVAIPRFALAVLIACLVLATAAVSIVRAQSKPLWFQFGWGLDKSGNVFHYIVAQKGYDDTQARLTFFEGKLTAVALRVKVESLSEDDVVLRCRAVPARTKANSTGGATLLGGPEGGISLDNASTIDYKPGEALAIPIEGGGTVYLKGEVLDRQPKIAFGLPLEPAADKLVVRSPVLIGPFHEVLGDMNGSTVVATNDTRGVQFRAGSNGSYTFALRPFAGAVQGEANWGEITFELDGQKYRLVAAAPITSGDQPRPVWVGHDPQPVSGVSLGAGQTPK